MNNSQERTLWWLTRASKEELEEALKNYSGPYGGSLTRTQVAKVERYYDFVYRNVREEPAADFDSSDSDEEDDPNDPEWVPSRYYRRTMRRPVEQEVEDDPADDDDQAAYADEGSDDDQPSDDDEAADVKEEPNDEDGIGIVRVDSEDEASSEDADVKEEPNDEMEVDQDVREEPEDGGERVDPAADVKEEPEDPWAMLDRPPFVIRGEDGRVDPDLEFDENFLQGPEGPIIF